MTSSSRTAATSIAPAAAAAPFIPTAWWAAAVMDANRLQWNAFLTWQQSLAAFQKDLWEQWAVRYTGGCPIDG
jgi:hypothetical protein